MAINELMRFKDDAANFGKSRPGPPNWLVRAKILLNRVLAVIVRLPAGPEAMGGVVAGPHRIAFSRHSLAGAEAWRPLPQTVARCQRRAPERA